MSKYTNNKLLSIFTNWFTFSSMSDIHQTSFASKGNLQIPTVQKTHGKNAFVYGYKNLEWYSERNECCDFKHIFISYTKIITHWVLLEYV